MEDTCSICLCEFENRAKINSCDHEFCVVCIRQWAQVKLTCPVCYAVFQTVVYNLEDDQVSEIMPEPEAVDPDDVKLDLSGLSCKYFIEEISRMVQNVERMKLKFLKNDDSYSSSVANKIQKVLVQKWKSLENLDTFDEVELMQLLVRIEENLNALYMGKIELIMIDDLLPPEEYEYELDDDYYDYDEYDEYDY
eukprot:TRINITY_DN9894_c0_g1_i1.p1 TRINITY_DN9894_c0_g1~~TRINITY_DN9894_c0_g1_i1.p1  ORF type:complete len:194 (+),score=42.64 TRINITY_DN9894_c0_g1_i1:1-582(+)